MQPNSSFETSPSNRHASLVTIQVLQQLHQSGNAKMRIEEILLQEKLGKAISKEEFIAGFRNNCQDIDTSPITKLIQSYEENIFKMNDDLLQQTVWSLFEQQLLQNEKQAKQAQILRHNFKNAQFPEIVANKFCTYQIKELEQKNLGSLNVEGLDLDLDWLQQHKQQDNQTSIPTKNDIFLSSYKPFFPVQVSLQQGQKDRDNSLEEDVQVSNQEKNQSKNQSKQLITLQAFNKEVFKRCMCRLLSIDVTKVFSQELKEVLQVIRAQINLENSYLVEKMMKFLQMFDFLRNITSYFSAQSQTEQRMTQVDLVLSQYQKYLTDGNKSVKYSIFDSKSQVYQMWLKLQKQLQISLAKPREHLSHAAIKQHLHSSLQGIKLYYTPGLPNDNHFGQSTSSVMLINLNHISPDITIQQFKNGSLRPYLYLVIVHEMTHRTIRKMHKNLIVQDNQTSIQLQRQDNDSIYGHIIKFICKYKQQMVSMLKQLGLNIQQLGPYQILSQIITRKIKRWTSVIKLSCQLIPLWRQNQVHIYAIRKKLRQVLIIDSLIKKFNLSALTDQSFDNLLGQILQCKLQSGRALSSREKFEKGYANFLMSLITSFEYFKVAIPKESNQTFIKAASHIRDSQLRNHFILRDMALEGTFLSQAKKMYERLQQYQLLAVFQEFLERNPLQILESMFKKMVGIFFNSTNQQYIEDLLLNSENIAELDDQQTKTILHLKGLLKQSDLRKMSDILKAQQVYTRSLEHLKFSEVYAIAADVPIFYLCKMLYPQSPYDTGYFMEQALFPRLNGSRYIFAKDFQILKTLNIHDAQKVGIPPLEMASLKNCVRIQRFAGCQRQPQDFVPLPKTCGRRRHQIRQQLMKGKFS